MKEKENKRQKTEAERARQRYIARIGRGRDVLRLGVLKVVKISLLLSNTRYINFISA